MNVGVGFEVTEDFTYWVDKSMVKDRKKKTCTRLERCQTVGWEKPQKQAF